MHFFSDRLKIILFQELKLPKHSRFAVAYSGGLDSNVLLHGMFQVMKSSDIKKLSALHYDHGIHSESARWALHCEKQTKKLGVQFFSHRGEVVCKSGENLEAKSRETRYRWFEEVLEEDQILLTAHHANDQAETILMNLFKGKGAERLSGMMQCRLLSYRSSVYLIRPLLNIKKSVLEAYAAHHRLSWVDDPSNQTTLFDRNYLRKNILTKISERWPNAVPNIVKTSRQVEIALRDHSLNIKRLYQTSLCPEKKSVFCLFYPLYLKKIENVTRDTLIDLIRFWIHQASFSSPSEKMLEKICNHIFNQELDHISETHLKTGTFNYGCYSVRVFNFSLYLTGYPITISRRKRVWCYDFSPYVLPGTDVELVVIKTPGKGLSPSLLREDCLALIWRQGGERVQLPGRRHHHSLKKLYQFYNIPPWERQYLPYLASASRDQIVWVSGIGVMADYQCMEHETGINLRFKQLND